jgi:hypothetical protein
MTYWKKLMKMNEEDKETLHLIDQKIKKIIHPRDFLWYVNQKIQILKRYGLISTSERNSRKKSK